MTVADLIAALQKMPQHAEVVAESDRSLCPFTKVRAHWMTRTNKFGRIELQDHEIEGAPAVVAIE